MFDIMGTSLFILCFTAVLTLPEICNAIDTPTEMDATQANEDVYLQLLRRVEYLEKRDHQQQVEIDTLRGELNAEKQRNIELDGKLGRLQNFLAQQHGNDKAKSSVEQETPATAAAWTIQKEPSHSSKPEQQTPRIRRHVDMPVIAFHATLTHHSLHTGVHQNIAFDHVITNIGAAYSPYTGSFVAPVTGVYVFHTTIAVYTNGVLHISMVKNTSSVANLYIRGTESVGSTDSAMVVLHLNKGDNVIVQNNDSDSGINGDHYSMFSGFLLYLDDARENIVG